MYHIPLPAHLAGKRQLGLRERFVDVVHQGH